MLYSKINILKKIEPDAEKFILDNDRMLYAPFFEAAEKYCADNLVLIGGRVGIDLLVGKLITKDSFYWDLYTDNTFNNAKELAIILSNVKSHHVSADTVALQTNIRHKEFTLSVSARILFKIYAMDKYRDIKLVQLMGPASRTSYFAKIPISCISEEIQLIEIYRTLYSPAKISMWRADFENEKLLYNLIKDILGEKATKTISIKVGGKTNTEYQTLILNKLLANSDNILIGDHALNAIHLDSSPSRIQFISGDDIEDLRLRIEKILTNSNKVKITELRTTYVKYSLNLPMDFQITKHTIYIINGRDQTPIVDIFNSSQFEMIPFTQSKVSDYKNIKIGNPWVLLRFLFIDIWSLKLILNIGTDQPEFIKSKIIQNLHRADVIRQFIYKPANTLNTFQLHDYVGVNINENVAKKKLIKDLGERFPTFYPIKVNTNVGDTDNTNIMNLID